MTIKNEEWTSVTDELLVRLSAAHEPPCLSIYQPTHRRYPDNQQDPIRFRNLLKVLEASLLRSYPAAATRLFLEPFEALAQRSDFWNHTLDGLAVLGAPGIFRSVRIPEAVSELAVVADSFHTKPLRRFLQSADRYQVLGLGLERVRFFEGNRHALDEIDLGPGVPQTITDALGDQLSGKHRTVYAGVRGTGTPAYHGDGGKKDEIDNDTDRFFRAVDRAVIEQHSAPSGLPLILAALPEHHSRFHQVSKNSRLVKDSIRCNPESLAADELGTLAWQAMEPQYSARLATLGDDFERARAQGVGSDDLEQVAHAAASGRIATLLIESERELGGRIDPVTGRVERADLHDPRAGDLLDDLGNMVTKAGGRVLVIPAARMTTQTGLAATYRY